MSEEVDFSELRNYLMGQMDLGDAELYLDEPWALTRKPAMAGARPAVPGRNPPPIPPSASLASAAPRPVSMNPAPRPVAPAATANPVTGAQNIFGASAGGPAAPAPRAVKRTVSAYESAGSLQDFYGNIKAEALYAKETDIVRYMGPEHPKFLFLLPAVKPGADPAAFFQSPVGEMLVRLFASLNVAQESIGVTYFFKSGERPLSPLLETALKKMLTKELSFIAPQAMITFGQPLFHQLFGKAKSFDELAGSDQEFAGVKTCSLVDPYAMVNDKQLKWITWKVHIPRSTLFAK
ncbi:MAG: hypothetical protein MJY93_06180 [Fibrobacter sp.]|nr:hypothetical protein [Fibrobacter sp.]